MSEHGTGPGEPTATPAPGPPGPRGGDRSAAAGRREHRSSRRSGALVQPAPQPPLPSRPSRRYSAVGRHGSGPPTTGHPLDSPRLRRPARHGAGQPCGTPTAPSPGGAPAPAGRSGSASPDSSPGALIGGGAGAGVVALLDDRPSHDRQPAPRRRASTIKNPETATTATAAAAKAAPSVVTIYVSNGSSSGSGSGVVLTDDGYVLTNNHVVTLEGTGTGTVQVRTADGTLYDAKVVGTDPSSDLAVVKLDGASGLTPATFADSDKVQVGDLAVAIGAPLGLSNTVTDGIISATGRAVATGSTQNDATVIDAIQTDAAINPGQLRRRAGQRRRRGHRHQHRHRDRRLRQPRVSSRPERQHRRRVRHPEPTPPSGSPRSSSRTARPPTPSSA